MIAWAWLAILMTGGADGDRCMSQVPARLARDIDVKFPGCALPRMDDNLAADIAISRRHGGNGCLGAACADFDGDGADDIALLLTCAKDEEVLVVVALSDDGMWRVEKLRTWKSERSRIYVAVVPPGKYARSESFDGPPSEAGEMQFVESKLPGIVTGRTEASGIHYFLRADGWKHGWVTN